MVNGTSMTPNFNHREYILTEKVTFHFSEPQRGNVVVFKYPKDVALHYIKRIVGMPEETIRLEGGSVYIDGVKLIEEYLPPGTETYGNTNIADGVDYDIGENQYVLLGDNRTGSSDSRVWGMVDRELIIGKAFFRYWPLSRIGLTRHGKY